MGFNKVHNWNQKWNHGRRSSGYQRTSWGGTDEVAILWSDLARWVSSVREEGDAKVKLHLKTDVIKTEVSVEKREAPRRKEKGDQWLWRVLFEIAV